MTWPSRGRNAANRLGRLILGFQRGVSSRRPDQGIFHSGGLVPRHFHILTLLLAVLVSCAGIHHVTHSVDPRSIEGVEVAAFISEIGEGFFKVSLRSRGGMNVERIAGAFGGGGHHSAAACRIAGDLESVKAKLVEAVISDAIERNRRD